MPRLSNRDYAPDPHPPACACAECVVERRHWQDTQARQSGPGTQPSTGDPPRYPCPYCDRGLIIRPNTGEKARCPNCDGKTYLTRRPTRPDAARFTQPEPVSQPPVESKPIDQDEWRLPPITTQRPKPTTTQKTGLAAPKNSRQSKSKSGRLWVSIFILTTIAMLIIAVPTLTDDGFVGHLANWLRNL